MSDEVARIDKNYDKTQLGVVDATKTANEEIRKIRTTDKGAVKVDTGAGLLGSLLKVTEESSHFLKDILVELKINNKILNEVHDLNVTELDVKQK